MKIWLHTLPLTPLPQPVCPSTPLKLLSLSLCRGKFRSKAWAQVLEEARHLVESGVVELNLIAGE